MYDNSISFLSDAHTCISDKKKFKKNTSKMGPKLQTLLSHFPHFEILLVLFILYFSTRYTYIWSTRKNVNRNPAIWGDHIFLILIFNLSTPSWISFAHLVWIIQPYLYLRSFTLIQCLFGLFRENAQELIELIFRCIGVTTSCGSRL